jgi:hypothetical protein
LDKEDRADTEDRADIADDRVDDLLETFAPEDSAAEDREDRAEACDDLPEDRF